MHINNNVWKCLEKDIVIFPEKTSLIKFANKFGTTEYPAPLPLRRTCSILREYGFGTLLCESLIWEKKETGNCNYSTKDNHACGVRYFSCNEYDKILEDHYDAELLKKECFKIAFFKTVFEKEKDLKDLDRDDLKAICIVHRDTLLKHGCQKISIPPYVTESIINIPEKRKNVCFLTNYVSNIIIGDREFQVEGNYFCQQNHVTNCCSQAAIKMAVRGYYPDITAEKINEIAGVDHKKRKGNEGFNPEEFVNTIKNLTGQEAQHFDIRSYETPLFFMKLIYHAIESRFPAILLFAYGAEKSLFPPKHRCHAAALIGHTFNKNNWWSYAWKGYFSGYRVKLKYLPSVMWCDNFLIQDDNFGPYYFLPLHSLRILDIPSLLPNAIIKIIQNTRFHLSKIWPKVYLPMHCIITYPDNSVHFEDVLKVEPYSLEWLEKNFAEITKDMNLDDNIYNEYFYLYLENRTFVLRTLAMSRGRIFG